MASYRFKGGAYSVVFQLVVTTDHPGLPFVFHPHLRGSDHVTGWEQRNIHAIQMNRFSPVDALVRLRTHSQLHQRNREFMREIGIAAPTGMITVRMSNYG